jgi:hypothetical protein
VGGSPLRQATLIPIARLDDGPRYRVRGLFADRAGGAGALGFLGLQRATRRPRKSLSDSWGLGEKSRSAARPPLGPWHRCVPRFARQPLSIASPAKPKGSAAFGSVGCCRLDGQPGRLPPPPPQKPTGRRSQRAGLSDKPLGIEPTPEGLKTDWAEVQEAQKAYNAGAA